MGPSRRDFLSAFAAAAVLRAARARAQSAGATPGLFEITKLAEGVYAAVARPAALINCNAVIFENANDLLVVDSHSKPSAAASLLAQVRREVSPKPVGWLVNTHFHWDHTQGNSALTKASPHVAVIASTATRNLIQEFGERRLKETLEQLPARIERDRKRLAAARTPEEKAYFEKSIAESKAYLAEMRSYQPELPTITFQDTLVLHDRAHELHLAFRGRGHTAGDVVVYCPQKKAIATGDLAHGFLPYIGDGYPREWPKTLRTVAEFDFDHLAGGHGAPQRGRDRMLQMAAYIEELTELVAKGKREGRTEQELEKSIRPADLKSISNGGYGEFVVASLKKYSAIEPAVTRAEILEDGVRGNIAAIYATLDRS